jgi:phosphoserine aminotransferase
MAQRLINFSAGPSALPLEILQEAQADLINYKGCGMSVMEMSHRSKEYESIHKKAEADLRDLLHIPDNYKVLFMQGGASLQFACIPLNLLRGKSTANYLTTGAWSVKALEECNKYARGHEVATGKSSKFANVPGVSNWNIDTEGAYFHYCNNETIHGLELNLTEEMYAAIGSQTIVADMSSNFLSQPVDVSKHGVIYAGAQKNAGPAGVTIVIVREDLLGQVLPVCPTMCDWKVMADNQSLYNTPPCFAIYMCGLYFDYMKRNGGVERFHEISVQKSRLIYDLIDNSGGFYSNPVEPTLRSRMNIPFLIKNNDEALQNKFLAEAKVLGLVNLAGHRAVGGLRASIYNGLSLEDVQKLVDFMREFQTSNA